MFVLDNINIKLVEQVRQEGREYLYQLAHPNYRNNCMKQIIWREISAVVGISADEAMKRWKALRGRYIKITKQPKSGSAAKKLSSKDEWLMRALDFLKVHTSNE